MLTDALMMACRRISDEATAMIEKARWSGARAGDQIMVGRRGVAQGIVADSLSALSSAVAQGGCPDTAYANASESLRAAIKRFNAPLEWQIQEWDEHGQDTLRAAYWRLKEAAK